MGRSALSAGFTTATTVKFPAPPDGKNFDTESAKADTPCWTPGWTPGSQKFQESERSCQEEGNSENWPRVASAEEKAGEERVA